MRSRLIAESRGFQQTFLLTFIVACVLSYGQDVLLKRLTVPVVPVAKTLAATLPAAEPSVEAEELRPANDPPLPGCVNLVQEIAEQNKEEVVQNVDDLLREEIGAYDGCHVGIGQPFSDDWVSNLFSNIRQLLWKWSLELIWQFYGWFTVCVPNSYRAIGECLLLLCVRYVVRRGTPLLKAAHASSVASIRRDDRVSPIQSYAAPSIATYEVQRPWSRAHRDAVDWPKLRKLGFVDLIIVVGLWVLPLTGIGPILFECSWGSTEVWIDFFNTFELPPWTITLTGISSLLAFVLEFRAMGARPRLLLLSVVASGFALFACMAWTVCLKWLHLINGTQVDLLYIGGASLVAALLFRRFFQTLLIGWSVIPWIGILWFLCIPYLELAILLCMVQAGTLLGCFRIWTSFSRAEPVTARR